MVASTSRKKAISFTLLSIMLPLGVLVSLRIGGVVPEPPKQETITMETVEFELERPSSDVSTFKNYFSEGKINVFSDDAMSLGVILYGYMENSSFSWHDGLDSLEFAAYVNLTNTTAHRYYPPEVVVKLQPTDAHSEVWVSQSSLVWGRVGGRVVNVSAAVTRWLGTNATEACVRATANSSSSRLEFSASWVFEDENDEDHALKITFEVAHLQGRIYSRAVIPVMLKMVRRLNQKL
jgi:hypothetical protein